MSSIHFYEKGEGQALVFIHGFCETSEMWHPFAEEFSKNFRVVCPDLPGFGKSPLQKEHFSLEEIAVELESFFEENQISEPILIGHSLGGYIALALLELMGTAIKGIGLFHSTVFGDDISKKEMRDRTVYFLEKFGVEKFVTTFVPQLFPDDRREDLIGEINLAVTQAKRSSLEGLIGFTKAMKDRKDRFEALANYRGPSLFIAGTEDGAVKIEASRKHQTIVTEYHELQNVGHMGMIEEKEKTRKIIASFCLGIV